MEKMLTIKALDERDLLEKKIRSKIKEIRAIACKRIKDPKLKTGESVEEFTENVKSSYQQLNDMIARYNKIYTAIIQANAAEQVEIQGEKMSRAKAIGLKAMYNTKGDFKLDLLKILQMQYSLAMEENAKLQRAADDFERELSNNMTSKDVTLSEAQIAASKTLSEGYQPQIIDPLGLKDLLDKELEKQSEFKSEIDTAIQTSNATTYVEF